MAKEHDYFKVAICNAKMKKKIIINVSNAGTSPGGLRDRSSYEKFP